MGQLTDRCLKRQIARLKSLPRGEDRPWGTDNEPGLRDELLRVLRQRSSDDTESERIIDLALQNSKFAPTPAELIEYADAVFRARPADEGPRWTSEGPPLCNRCNSQGTLQDSVGRWIRCDCENGLEYPQSLLDLANKRDERLRRWQEEGRAAREDIDEVRATLARAIASRLVVKEEP
jgi:hypothetical protein